MDRATAFVALLTAAFGLAGGAGHAAPRPIIVDTDPGTDDAMAILLAGIRGIDQEIWKASKIDGIPTWQTYLFIVIPMMRGAVATIRKALSADVTLNPALVRVRTRMTRSADRAAFAGLLTATPGMAVVETDAEGFLMHVIDEDSIDADELGRLERAAGGAGP